MSEEAPGCFAGRCDIELERARQEPRDYTVAREQLQRLVTAVLDDDGPHCLDAVSTIAAVDFAIQLLESARREGP